MLGTCHEILSDVPYVVDEEVQLVCKYLKGYHIGGTKGIDRLYKEGVHVWLHVCEDNSSNNIVM